jgi:hypothetical protein
VSANISAEDANGRPAAEVHDRDRHRYVGVERLAGEHALQPERAVGAHADRGDQRRDEAADRVRVGDPVGIAAVQVDRREQAPRGGRARGAGQGKCVVHREASAVRTSRAGFK